MQHSKTTQQYTVVTKKMTSKSNKKQKIATDLLGLVLAEIKEESFFQERFRNKEREWKEFHEKYCAEYGGRDRYRSRKDMKELLSSGMKNVILQEENSRLRTAIQEKDEVIQEHQEENSALRTAIQHKDKVLLTMTIAGLLQQKDSRRFELLARGTDSSYAPRNHKDANAVKMKFSVCAIPSGDGTDWAALANLWNENQSSLLGLKRDPEGKLGYFNEADIQSFSYAAVTDAVDICNQLFVQVKGPKHHLSQRREASLLSSNRPDHTVIFDSVSGNSILTIADKIPCDGIEQEPKVCGQMFDYLLAMATVGHPNPFAILTTFQSTWVCCLNPGDAEIPKATDRFDFESVSQIVKYLPESNGNSSQMGTPTSATPSTPSLQNELDEELKPMARKFYMSKKAFETHELVPVLCNAILCAIKNFNWKARTTLNLSREVNYSGYFLAFMENDYDWVTGRLPFSGHPATQQSSQGTKFYVVEQLGMGETSRALRAVTEKGDECVIKMYVRMYEDNVLLETSEFEKVAEDSVQRELEHYHAIYEDLKENVWTTKLMGFHCIILPYFEPVPIQCESLPSIKETLSNFKPHNLGFADSDMDWRHVGIFNNKVYLFDLADLEPLKENEFEAYVEKHVEVLQVCKKKQMRMLR